ncbi:MAG: fimbrillin family protein [Muribaculaceae bacterium]|nr:fimbrillin family protein [Muribaculaceae bacterium]
MKITRLIPAACLMIGMSACDTEKEIPVYGEDSGAIHIDATIGSGFARSNPYASDDMLTQFNDGDEIRLSCEDGYLDYALAGGTWSPTDNYYLRWGDEPMTYNAYHPVTDGTDVLNFTLPANQQRIENMANADYMTCTVENAVDNGSHILHLNMMRRMAKVVMTIDEVSGQNKANGVKIGSYSGYTAGQVNTAVTLVSPLINAPEGGKPGQNGCTYTAIVTPGKASASATFVSLNYLGDDMVLQGIPEMTPGMCYEFTLKVEGSIITLSEPVVSPWTSGTLQGGDAEELQLSAYYVKEQPCGNATGVDWDNAMGVDAMRQLLVVNSDRTQSDSNAARIDGKTIHMAAGKYEMAQNNTGLKIEYSGYSKQVEITILGGYDPASTGSDLSKRDPGKFVTALIRNAGSNASATSNAMMVLGNQTDITFDGCTFDGQHQPGDDGVTRAWQVSAGGSGNATLHLTDCVIKNFNRKNVSGNADSGAALKLTKGRVMLDNVEMTGNTAKDRGGAINVAGNENYLYMNNCLLRDNISPSAWGTAIHSAGGYVCMNNVTIIGATGAANNNIIVNGDACFIVANTTIIGASGNPYGVFRAGRDKSLLVNSLFAKGTGTRTIYAGNIVSGGYNVFQAADSNWGATDTDTDFSDQTLPAVTLTDGVYQWQAGAPIDSYATRQEVIDAIKGFNAIGADFVNWVGESGFGKDQRGAARNTSRMQPGAYDAGL